MGGNLVKDRGGRKVARLLADSRWAGITNIASGDTTVVVSATSVKSGQNIMTGLGITPIGSHTDLVTSPNSVVTNTSMVIQVQNAVVGTQPVWWMVAENF